MTEKLPKRILSAFKNLDNKPGAVSWLAFAVIFVSMLAYLVQRVDQPYYYDASNYWQLGSSFTASGNFSLLNFAFQLRGYFFPLFLFLLKWKASLLGVDAKLLFAIYSAGLFALLTAHIIPCSLRVIFQWRTGLAGRLVFALLLFYFWRGHFLYPLTDFPALAILLLGLTSLVHTVRNQASPFWALLIGLLFGAVINIRPIYQASLLVVLVLALIGWSRSGWKHLIVRGVLSLVGVALVLLPQFWINRVNFNANTPLVLAKYYGDANLYVAQIFQGMKYQKYETNVGGEYPTVEMRYSDPIFEKIPKDLRTEWSLQNYMTILRRYPLDVMVSYFKHAFNGLDVLYSTPYLQNVFADRTLFSLINYLIWFLCLYYFAQSGFHGTDYVQFLGAAVLLAPVALAIPTVIEVRFFLPLTILAYGTVCYKINYREFLASLRRDPWHLWRFVILCGLWILTCLTLSAGTVQSLP
jgi:hypothetical protein